MHPFTRAHEPAQPPEGTSFAPLRNIVLTLVASIAAAGCASTDIDEIPAASGAITVGLDVSSRVAVPGRQIVYRVEIHNGLEEAIDISDLEIELSVVPPDDPDTVRLRQSWPYRSTQRVEILPGRHATIPIRPKTVVFKLPLELQYQVGKAGGAQSEFPVDRLSPGTYHVIATVNGRWQSPPCKLDVGIDPLEKRLPPAESRSAAAPKEPKSSSS
ncbi:MAG TPA: hypothetical protein VK116_13685 [Planctomycetota bacterium]|nr:hypothetical protein [Planctomycetota bacterium]